MFRVKGIDSFDKVVWLTARHYWTPVKAESAVFTRAGAEACVRDQNRRNLYIDSNDRVIAELEAQ